LFLAALKISCCSFLVSLGDSRTGRFLGGEGNDIT